MSGLTCSRLLEQVIDTRSEEQKQKQKQKFSKKSYTSASYYLYFLIFFSFFSHTSESEVMNFQTEPVVGCEAMLLPRQHLQANACVGFRNDDVDAHRVGVKGKQ